MRNVARVAVILGLGIAAAISIRMMLSPREDRVRFHLDRLEYARSHGQEITPRITDYLNPSTWSWYFHGKPRTARWEIKAIQAEEKALVRLGYFEQRKFTLRRRAGDNKFHREFGAAVQSVRFPSTSLGSNLPPAPFFSLSTDFPSSVITLIARKTDMPAFERIVNQLDKQDGK